MIGEGKGKEEGERKCWWVDGDGEDGNEIFKAGRERNKEAYKHVNTERIGQ